MRLFGDVSVVDAAATVVAPAAAGLLPYTRRVGIVTRKFCDASRVSVSAAVEDDVAVDLVAVKVAVDAALELSSASSLLEP